MEHEVAQQTRKLFQTSYLYSCFMVTVTENRRTSCKGVPLVDNTTGSAAVQEKAKKKNHNFNISMFLKI